MPPRALYRLTSDKGAPLDDDGLRDGERLRGRMTDRLRGTLAGSGVP
ncbi:hypothetical protein ACFWN1_30175 [Streptomyces sp. NPDC058459]